MARPKRSSSVSTISPAPAAALLAVDVPSGIDGETGSSLAAAAVEATASVTFFRLEAHGHLLLPGRTLAGEIRLADIGIPDARRRLRPSAPCLRQRAGRLALGAAAPGCGQPQIPCTRRCARPVGRGPPHRRGSPRRSRGAARGRRHCQRGEPARRGRRQRGAIDRGDGGARSRTPGEFEALLADDRRRAIALGPGAGVGATLRKLVAAALTRPAEARTIVLDADALVSFAGDAARLAALIKRGGHQAVMTPHEGEFAKLFEGAPDIRLEDDKLTRARAAARLMGAVVLIKGADTVVAAPDGRATIGWDLPPWLATAGSGDVLSGLVSGLAAQGMAAFEAASAAVWLHGACGRAVGPGLIAEDLPEALPGVLRALG